MMDTPGFPSASCRSIATIDQNAGQCRRSGSTSEAMILEQPRRWHDVFWSGIFVIHLIGFGFVLGILGLNRFKKKNRLDIDKYTYRFMENQAGLTEDYWPLYAVACGVATALGWCWLSLLGSCATQMMKISVHILTTYLAVISVLCFWAEQFFWGVAFAIGASLEFLYVISVIDRLPFTMLVLQKAVKMVWNIPEAMRVAHAFMLVVLLWMVLWSFGVAGVVASSMGDGGRWWLLVVLSVSLFWTGAVLCNIVHVIVSGMVFLVHGCRETESIPANSVMKSLRYALTTSFGSICYGSLFTAAIRTLRWEIRGIRSKIGKNECLLCCVDFLFHIVETLVRFFNKYAYVQIAIYGKSFNHSARDAWELLQSSGVEALVAHDCSGAILLMGTICGGLITGTCSGVWAWIKWSDRAFMIGSTSMLMGMVLGFLEEFNDVFPQDIPSVLPPTRGIEHKIDFLPHASLPNRPTYKTNPIEAKEIQRQVEDLLGKGWVRESLSPCAVSVILVPKNEGTWRMCTNCTIMYRHSISRLNDLLDELHDASVFSKIDLKSGYLQIRMKEGDGWKQPSKPSLGCMNGWSCHLV